MAAKKRKKLSGKKRMREQGYKLCELWFDSSELRTLEQLQLITAKPFATMVRELAVAAATDALLNRQRQQSEKTTS